GLRGFEQAARELRPLAATFATQVHAQWPDFRAATAAVEAQQLALRRTGTLVNVDIAEEANTDAFVRALIDLAETLHTSPADLRERAKSGAEPRSVALRGLYHCAAAYGLRVGLGTTVGHLIGIAEEAAELLTV